MCPVTLYVCSHGQVLLKPQGLFQQGPEIVGRSITKACKGTCLKSIKTILLAGWTLACSEPFPFLHVWQASSPITHFSHHPVPTAGQLHDPSGSTIPPAA